MALQMVRSFFGQGTPSRSWVHEPVIDSESFGNQDDTGDVGKPADSNWFELARHPTSELGRKPHTMTIVSVNISYMRMLAGVPVGGGVK